MLAKYTKEQQDIAEDKKRKLQLLKKTKITFQDNISLLNGLGRLKKRIQVASTNEERAKLKFECYLLIRDKFYSIMAKYPNIFKVPKLLKNWKKEQQGYVAGPRVQFSDEYCLALLSCNATPEEIKQKTMRVISP